MEREMVDKIQLDSKSDFEQSRNNQSTIDAEMELRNTLRIRAIEGRKSAERWRVENPRVK